MPKSKRDRPGHPPSLSLSLFYSTLPFMLLCLAFLLFNQLTLSMCKKRSDSVEDEEEREGT